jgi:hypothetical protein
MRKLARSMMLALWSVSGTLGIVLLVGGAVLWVRSYWTADQITMQAMRRTPARWSFATCRLWSECGGVIVGLDLDDTVDETLVRFYRKMPIGPFLTNTSRPSVGKPILQQVPFVTWGSWSRWGFGYRADIAIAPTVFSRYVHFPHWFLVIVGLVLSGPWIAWTRRAWINRRRRRAGLCVKCGYDLRASPQRCPECGAMVDQSMPGAPSKLGG